MPKYMTLKEVAKLLELSIYQVRLFLKQATINAQGLNRSKEVIYDSVAIHELHDYLEKLYTENKTYKYSSKELKELGCNTHDKSKLNPKPTNLFDRYKRFKGIKFLYEKSEVDMYLKSKNNDLKVLDLNEIKALTGFQSKFQLECALKDCKISTVKKGESLIKYYRYEDVLKFQEIVLKRYIYNQKFMLSTKQVKNLGLKKFDLPSLKTYKAEPLDRVYEFEGILALYKKSEVEEKLQKKASSTILISEKDARRLLGFNNQSKFKKLVEEYNIPYKTEGKYEIIYYEEGELQKVKKIIDDNYNFNLETKITSDEIKELGYSRKFIRKLTPVYTKTIDNVYKYSRSVVFYDKSQFQEQVEKENIFQYYYTTSQLQELFNFSRGINIILKEANIFPEKFPHSKTAYWDKKDIDSFINETKNLYDYYEANYYVINEIENLLNMPMVKIYRTCSELNIPIQAHTIPNVIKHKKFHQKQKAFLKNEIDDITTKIKFHQSQINKKHKRITKLDISKSESSTLTVNSIIKKNENNSLELLLEQLEIFDNNTKSNIVKEVENYSTTKLIDEERLIISEQDFIKELDCYRSHFDKHILSYSLFNFKYGKIKFYLRKDCHIIFKNLFKKQSKFLEDKYLLKDASKKISKVLLSKDIFKVAISPDLAFGLLKKEKYVYYKEEVNKQYHSIQTSLTIETYKNALDRSTLINEIFLEAIDKLNLYFHNSVKNTEVAWLNFATTKLLSSNGNIQSLKKAFTRFIRITELLKSALTSQEIIKMNASEINFTFLNANIHITYKEILYAFFKTLAVNSVKCNYNPIDLKNPYAEKRDKKNSKQNKKNVYSPEEFLELIEYVKDVELHKNKAIKEMIQRESNLKECNYESVWLYIMLHLNNAWRSTDFIEKIPRITLPTSISDYTSFENDSLNYEEAERIIWELKSKVQNVYHNKNGKKAFFFISEEMTVPVANALILCELKVRAIQSTENNLINLGKSKELTTTMHNRFFKEFSLQNFKFKSLKANRSFITYVNSILKKKTNRNPLEITKFIRNHESLDTTNRYIHIEESHLNKISKELFDNGHFGYAYTYLKQLVIGDTKDNVKQIEHKDLLTTVFGDIYKIENFAIQFSAIEEKKHSLYEFVNNLTIEKQEEILNLITLKQLPAKEAFWQCILGDCLYLDRKCDSCPFAIPHFYTLTKTIQNLNALLKKLVDIKEIVLKGEKVRLVNLLYKNLLLLSAAKKQFGENVISAFLGKEYSEFLDVIRNLNEINENLTIKEKN